MKAMMKVAKIGETAIMPVRGSPLSAGFDLSSAYDVVVPAHGKAIVKTDLAISIPVTCYARIAPRSGLAWKKHIDVGAGVVDADYRGNVGVILFNHADEDFSVKVGDRVAQLILQHCCLAGVSEVGSIEELGETSRGAGGFGSTGVSGSVAADSMKIEGTSTTEVVVEGGEEVMRVAKIGETAIMPVRGSPLSAGFDLSSAYDVVVPAHGKAIVKTDLAISIPVTCYARIAPRSGLAWKKHIDVGAGVVDADYRGNVGVILFNHADEDFSVKVGDRVAQLILENCCLAGVSEVGSIEELGETSRGAGGFGSTGVSGSVAADSMKIEGTSTTEVVVEGGEEVMRVAKIGETAIMPVRGSPLSAGFDLSSAYDVVVPAHGKAIVKTDLAISIPVTCYARIAPRSGLAWKKHIDVGAGVVDADYRGNVGVILFNHADEDFSVKVGDRVAQLILQHCCLAGVSEVGSIEELGETSRGAGGFGSTGVSGGVAKQKDSPPKLQSTENIFQAAAQGSSASKKRTNAELQGEHNAENLSR